MTERNFGETTQTWIGIVTNVFDPHECGRVQVRVFGRHDDTVNIPDEVLPFAQVIQPVTSAARGRMGTAPVGLVVGSRVIGIWLDRDHQYPLILGVVGRAGEEKEGQTEDGAPAINTNTGSIPSATQASVHNAYTNLDNSNRVTVEDIDINGVNIDSVPRELGPVITEAVEDHMDIPKYPTTGAGDENESDILVLLRSVDPSNLIPSLPCFPSNALQVNFSIDFASLAAGFLSSLANALVDALLSLADRFGLSNILNAINAAAAGLANFQNALNAVMSGGICGAPKALNSIAMGTNALAYAVGNIQMAVAKSRRNSSDVRRTLNRPTLPAIPSNTPTDAFKPASIADSPPDGYIQEYYTADKDPYPGYIKWTDPNGTGDLVFTLRNGEPNYSSAEEHMRYESQLAAQNGLSNYVRSGSLTSNALNDVLNSVTSRALATGFSMVLGSGLGSFGSIAGLARIIPIVVGNVTGIFTPKLGSTILPNRGIIGAAVNDFTVNQAILARRRDSLQLSVRKV